jgi:thioredoxin-like negative regulator of GroEL
MPKPWHRLKLWWEQHRNTLSESQRDTLRLAGGLAAVAAVAGLVYWFGLPWWRRRQHDQAMEQAGQFAEQNDYHNLLLALRRATVLEPTDPATWHEAEKYLSRLGSPEALVAREQLARLEPGNLAVRLALVQEALAHGRVESARAALASLDEAARRDVAFHRLAAAVALATGREAELESHLTAILAALPQDPDARFNLAAVRLWSLDPAAQAAARADLDTLTENPTYRIRAAIMLLTETARQRDQVRMLALLQLLVGRFAPGATTDFASPGIPGWEALIAGMKVAAAGKPEDAALLARWLADAGRAPEANLWIETLPIKVQKSPEVADAAAELSAQAGDLPRLDALLRDGAWGAIPDKVRILALAAHIQHLAARDARAGETWGDAVAACGNSVESLRALSRLGGLWQDSDGTEQALEALLTHQPQAGWAFEALRNSFTARGDLTKLYELYQRWQKERPDDDELAAAWVTLACTLGRDVPAAAARGEELYRGNPASPLATAAVAAGRWSQGRPAEAWQALAALPAEERRQPMVAYWSVLVLADLGRKEEAGTALAAISLTDLAAEPRALLKKAIAKIGLDPP